MVRVVQVQGDDVPRATRAAICTLAVPVEDVAARLGLVIEEWEEHGLGTARGGFVGIATGRVLLLSELAHARRHLGAKGPTVEVDMADLEGEGATGPAALLGEVVTGLGIKDAEIDWTHPLDADRHWALRAR